MFILERSTISYYYYYYYYYSIGNKSIKCNIYEEVNLSFNIFQSANLSPKSQSNVISKVYEKGSEHI